MGNEDTAGVPAGGEFFCRMANLLPHGPAGMVIINKAGILPIHVE